jgi:hypothetical protein
VAVFAAAHPVEIHTGAYLMAIHISAIPAHLIVSGLLMVLLEGLQELTFYIEDIYARFSGFFHAITQIGIGVEGIRES